jgi:Astacin (Peptidase family M12A)
LNLKNHLVKRKVYFNSFSSRNLPNRLCNDLKIFILNQDKTFMVHSNTDTDSEYKSSTEKGTTYISGITFGPKKVEYSIINGFAIFEGDIILGKVEELEKTPGSQEAAARVGQRFRWPSGFIPFTIDPNLPNQSRVTDAINHYYINTPIRFYPRTAEENWVNFTVGNGICQSAVGMQGNGVQQILLGNDCGTGQVMHEIGHTVGLWHEQSRTDRNNFVQINLQNVMAGEEHNFDQEISENAGTEYDYCSIMHYGAFAFSANNQPTITVLQPNRPCGNTIGQRNGLSESDISAINYLYVPTAVPSVIQELASQAGPILIAAQLVPEFTGPNHTNSWVFSQSPMPGQSVPRGTTVTMVLRDSPLP